MLVRLQQLESGTLRPAGDRLGWGWGGDEKLLLGGVEGESAPTSGNSESVASSWVSSAASAPHRPSSQTCNTSGRTWNPEKPQERQRCKGRQKQKRNTGEEREKRGKKLGRWPNHILVLRKALKDQIPSNTP